MRISFIARVVPVAAVAALVLPAAARAQNAAIVNNPATLELGADIDAAFGLGGHSSVQLGVPGRIRAGFFLPNNSRIEIEPAGGLSYRKTTGVPGRTIYDVELGALYHFRAPQDVVNATGATVAYVRPFLNYTGTTGAGSNENAVTLGGGLGAKLPFHQNLALRAEANLGYDFRNKAARLGLLAGMSFFTNR